MDFAPVQHQKFPLQRQIPSVGQPPVQLHPQLQQHLMAGYGPFMQGGNGQFPPNQMESQIGTGGPMLAPQMQGQQGLRPRPPIVPTGIRPPDRM